MRHRLVELLLDIFANVLAELLLRVLDWLQLPLWLWFGGCPFSF